MCSPVTGSSLVGLTTSRRGVNIPTGGTEYDVGGTAKSRFSSDKASRGSVLNVSSHPSGGVAGSTR